MPKKLVGNNGIFIAYKMLKFPSKLLGGRSYASLQIPMHQLSHR